MWVVVTCTCSQVTHWIVCVCVCWLLLAEQTLYWTVQLFLCSKNKYFFSLKMHLWYWLNLMWETTNSFYKLRESQFWREAAGGQGLFILSSSASLPTDTLKHVSSAKGFFSCFQGANDPRTRHCRLFYLTIVIPPLPLHHHRRQFEKQKPYHYSMRVPKDAWRRQETKTCCQSFILKALK